MTPGGPMRVRWECAPPKTTAEFLAMFAVVVKHFPPTSEQLAEVEARERAQMLLPPSVAPKSRATRGRR